MASLRRSQKPLVVEHKPNFPLGGLFFDELYIPKTKTVIPERRVLFDETFVSKFSKGGREIKGYNIEYDEPEHYSCGYGKIFGDQNKKVQYYDNPFVVVLTRGNEAIAFASYNIIRDTIEIGQIQGTYGKGEELKELFWGRAIISAIEEIAKSQRAKRIVVKSAKNSKYEEIRGNSNGGEAGFLIYDVNAKRCGFRRNNITGNYEKEID